jgi:D-alanyl-D-alanine carboxypeptidase (penicillin-binding protein 5/6)
MEEASVAGESPDRSKQHESSAEPTSGSAGPVPEARNETSTPTPRDPRLAVADTSTPKFRGGVDTATRVLSVRDLAEAAEEATQDVGEAGEAGEVGDGAREEAETNGSSTDASTAEKASGTDSGSGSSGGSVAAGASDDRGDARATGDDRLRDAVATWVATADEKQKAAPEDAQDAVEGAQDAAGTGETDQAAEGARQGESEGAGAAEEADDTRGAGGGEEASGAAQEAEHGETGAEAVTGAGGGEPDPGAARSAEDGEGSVSDAPSTEDTESAAEGAQDAVEGAQGGAEAEAGPSAGAEGADAPTDEDEPPAEDAEEAEPADSADDVAADGAESATATATAEDSAKADTETEPPAPDARKADTATETATDGAATESDGDGDGEPGPATAAGDSAEDDTDAKAAPETDAATDSDGDDDADGDGDGDGESGPAAAAGDSAEEHTDAKPAAGAGAETGDGPESGDDGDGTDADTDGDAAKAAASCDAKDADAKAGDDPEGTDDAEGTDGPAKGSDAKAGGAKRPVDQPTAVFQAVRPSAPAVDQPTTMLKFDGAAAEKASKKASEGDSGEAGTSPEAPVERTSKFVALKPLDGPVKRTVDVTSAVPQVGPERTTQQPLPPKPPLDLLAELTNTPPPPDTPVRTIVRRVKIWTPLVLLLAIVFAVVQSVRPLPTPELQLTAEHTYTFKGAKADMPWPSDGQAALDVQGIGTFGSSGEQKPVPIASVAKVMTAYVILRDHPLKSGADGPKIEIDQAAQDQSNAGQESTVDVTKGDRISQREALESILIASANNVARLLARWDAGSEKAFVGKMNDAAKDLGMTNTTYTDPSGLNNTTVSTAVDQVKLAKAAMKQPAFREVATMMSYVDYKGVKHNNWNQLVGYNDVVGIKTGTTTSALGNLVFAAKKEVDGETRRIVGAVVRQPAGGADNTILGAALDSGDKLIRAAQEALGSATILKKGDVVGYVDDGLGGRTPVVTTQNVTAVGWAGLTVKLTFAADDLPHTAKAGTQVGTLTVGDGSGSAVKVPVALQKDLVEPGFADKLTRLG